MNWRTALIVIASTWVLGWLGMSVFILARTASRRHRAGDTGCGGSRNGVGHSLILSFFLFPFICLQALGEFVPRLGVWLRLKSAWSIRAAGEDTSQTWRFKDGTEVSGFVSSLSKHVAAFIRIYCAADAAHYRLTQLAPEALPPTEWQALRRLSPDEKPADAGKNENVFLAEPMLQPGKYLVSFRVLNRSGDCEEFSGLTLIVT